MADFVLPPDDRENNMSANIELNGTIGDGLARDPGIVVSPTGFVLPRTGES